jgi:hypothetical protein
MGSSPALEDPRRCKAHSSRTGERCKRWAIRGGTVCSTHGGRSPAVKAAARRRLEERRVRTDMGRLLVELEAETAERSVDDVLVEQLHRGQAMVEVLGEMITQQTALFGPDHLGDGRPNVVATMYAEWVERTAKLAKLALDAGIDERKTQLHEYHQQQVVQVLRGSFDAVFEHLARHGVDADFLSVVRQREVPRILEQQALEVQAREVDAQQRGERRMGPKR